MPKLALNKDGTLKNPAPTRTSCAGNVWNPDVNFLEAGQSAEVVLWNPEGGVSYSVTADATAVAEVSPVHGQAPAAAETRLPDITLFLGVWTGSSVIRVTITKTPATCPPDPTKPAPAADAKATPGDPKICGIVIFTGSFTVHRFYHANLVGGFMASTLRNREFGATTVQQRDNTGAAITGTSGPAFVTVPTIGTANRPQLHPFVGVAWYWRNQDFFPGWESKWGRPAFVFGAVADETQSYMAGLQFEPYRSLTIGGGAHLGKETFLAPGVTPGTIPGFDGTHLSDVTKTPPTVTRPRGGAYFAIGFDLSLFKSVFGGGAGVK